MGYSYPSFCYRMEGVHIVRIGVGVCITPVCIQVNMDSGSITQTSLISEMIPTSINVSGIKRSDKLTLARHRVWLAMLSIDYIASYQEPSPQKKREVDFLLLSTDLDPAMVLFF
jgi:hypothetical protein